MFGNVTSSWANPQQNQQQQQQQQPAPGSFGQPSAFGATTTPSAFGSTSGAFGQPQQQQQAANPMFGSLSTPANNTGTSGFGTFGQAANNTNSAFGAKPAGSGFGAFGGGASTFGGTGNTSTFGQPAAPATTGTGLFGQPAATASTSTFGGAGGLFGANNNKPSVFGATSMGGGNPPVVTTGTSNPTYAAHANKEDGGTFHYQSISCIPAYAGYSFNELRVQDYQQGRKTASAAAPSAFGSTTSTFGGAQPSTTGTGLFGAPAAQPATTSAFGATPAAPASGFGAFGAPAQPAAQPAGGLFGGGSTFGATPTQPAQNTGFGTFGQAQPAQQQNQTGGLFGGGSTFGNTANKPATAFGAFGNTGTAAPATTGAFGNFGATNTQQPAQTGGLFGQPAQNQGTTGAFGNFGGTANKSIFGGGTTTAQPAATGFGGFGNTQQQQQQQPAGQTGGLFGGGGGLFGNTQNQQQQQQQPANNTGGLFGNAQNNAAATGSLFGGGGGLFGNNQNQQTQQQQQQPAQGGLFGAKPATTTGTGLFGGFGQQQNTNTQQAGGGLFGNSTLGQPQNQQQSTGFGGLFGNKPATAPLGQTMSTGGNGLFGSTFGNSTNNASTQQQPSLTASIAQPIGSNLPIFNLLPPGPRLVDLDQSQPKKKAPFFVDVPTRSPIPRPSTNKKATFAPANSKLRGFGASVAGQSITGNPFTNSNNVSFMNGKPGALSITDGRASSVGPDGFLGRSGSPALGSGARQSVKKVILDKKIEPSQLFIKSGSPGIPGSKVVFSPALSVAARESEAAAAAANARPEPATPTPAPRPQQRSPNRFGFGAKNADGTISDLEEGDYYVKPDLASLKKLGYEELSRFKGLVVGRVGYGEIEFLEPVDLTGLPKLSALLGDVIHFDPKECSVYPDSEDGEKPPPGSGLNVKSRLSLEGCWAMDKATREPLKDPKHPQVVKHLKRLKNMKDTVFEDFDMESGKWTFTVGHF